MFCVFCYMLYVTCYMLYVVATPIGNLKDITLRALETLKSVDYILCEDTRVTHKLLEHYQIKTPTISYHHHTPENKVREIIQLLSQGKNLALVTDAGTPGISDPGNKLISSLVYKFKSLELTNLKTDKLTNLITPVPGPSALIAALSISGFPTDKFLFLGFPPHKRKREKFFKEAADQKTTAVFYESPHRIVKTLMEISAFLKPTRELVAARELTKQFETIYRGNVASIIEQIKKDPMKGEFVIVIAPKK